MDHTNTPIPVTDRIAPILSALRTDGTAIFYNKAQDSIALRRRGRGKLSEVTAPDLGEMIKYGYVGRQDERAVWHLTKRGEIAIHEYELAQPVHPGVDRRGRSH